MCQKCEAKFGNMETDNNTQFLIGVGLGSTASIAGTKVIGKVVGGGKANSAEAVSGGGAALIGWYISDRAKKPLWKGFGTGMLGGGVFVAADNLIGGTIDTAVDSVFGGFGKSDTAPATTPASTLTAEQILLNALSANNTVSVGTGTGGTNFLF